MELKSFQIDSLQPGEEEEGEKEGEGRVEEEKKKGGRGSVVLLPESATKDNIISEAASLEELHSIVISIYCNGVIRTNDGWIF